MYGAARHPAPPELGTETKLELRFELERGGGAIRIRPMSARRDHLPAYGSRFCALISSRNRSSSRHSDFTLTWRSR